MPLLALLALLSRPSGAAAPTEPEIRSGPGWAIAVPPEWRTELGPIAALHSVGDGVGGMPRLDGEFAPLQVNLSVFRMEGVSAKDVLAQQERNWANRPGAIEVRARRDVTLPGGAAGSEMELRIDEDGRRGLGLQRVFEREGGTWIILASLVGGASGGEAMLEGCGVKDLVFSYARSFAFSADKVDRGPIQAAMDRYPPGLAEAVRDASTANDAILAGDHAAGAEGFRRALAVCEPMAGAHNGLAWALLHLPAPDPAAAVRHAERSVALSERRHPESLDTLALAYLAAGRREEAATTARACLALSPGYDACQRRLAAASGSEER